MGNVHNRMLFALTTTDNMPVQVQNFPPSYESCTVPGYNTPLALFSAINAFKITDYGRALSINDLTTGKIFKAKHVKTSNTRGQALRETYHIKDNSKNVLFKALECTDINVKPVGLLGYVYFEYRGNRGRELININIHDTFGNVVINTFRAGKNVNMIYTSTGQCVGSFQERNTHGTKGAITQDLDLRLKACILFAAGLTARFCYCDTSD